MQSVSLCRTKVWNSNFRLEKWNENVFQKNWIYPQNFHCHWKKNWNVSSRQQNRSVYCFCWKQNFNWQVFVFQLERTPTPFESYKPFLKTNLKTFHLQVQEARGQHDDEAVKRAINEYEDTLGRYIPVLMAQAKIYWELEMYQQVGI